MEIVGQIVSGTHGEILIREKSGQPIEIGELLVAENGNEKTLMQVYDLMYGSQLEQGMLEFASGMSMEEKYAELKFADSDLRHYILAAVKAVAHYDREKKTITSPKRLPDHFSTVRRFDNSDSAFITMPENPVYVGNLRSGSKDLNIPVHVNGTEAFSHHMLVPATTGRGKSNFIKVMLWKMMDNERCSVLVLDPHDEYYRILKNSNSDNLKYYTTKRGIAGAISLRIDVHKIEPDDLIGIISLSDPQIQALRLYRNRFKKDWLAGLMEDQDGIFENKVQPGTLGALQRKIGTNLGLEVKDSKLFCEHDVFDLEGGGDTVNGICEMLSSGKKIIIDTSMMMSEAELLVGSIIAKRVLDDHKQRRANNELQNMPTVSIVIEEAPRVLSEEKVKEGNIYATIAREGRKFRVGLIAITQLTSLIPKEVLANLNTKIIFGNELSTERETIISSASQDLSKDSKNIASLGKGEAVISSIFTNFAVPVKIPNIDDIITEQKSELRRVL